MKEVCGIVNQHLRISIPKTVFSPKPALLSGIPDVTHLCVKLFISMNILLYGLGEGILSRTLRYIGRCKRLENNNQRVQFQRLTVSLRTMVSVGETRNKSGERIHCEKLDLFP